jgi:dipeptidase E
VSTGQPTRRLVCVGGGGFLLDDRSYAQERRMLDLAQARHADGRKRALFLGTASGDSHMARVKFLECFARLGAVSDTLPFFPYEMQRDYAQTVLDADLIYVGGGNTVAMVSVWREFGFDQALRRAYEQGAVLAGISAGANCWFRDYVTDSVPGGGVRQGLAWVDAAFCPHLDSEAWRQNVVRGLPGRSYAAGEKVVMSFENESLAEVWRFADKTMAWVDGREHA